MRRGTFSIVARDAATGELGVAVQSHWFGVGPIVTWARPGIGAVATQSIAEPAHGPRALDLLASGIPAPDALAAVLAPDELRDVRQVAVVDSRGRVGAHTGAGCIPHAGHAIGAGVSCQANIMAATTVPAAMLAAYEAESGTLAQRLMAALEAAEGEGGDLRGRQSAALLIVPAAGAAWRTAIDVRVDDHPVPLDELRRLLGLARAYELADAADAALATGDHEAAGRLYEEASDLAPDHAELIFWAALAAAHSGDLATAVARAGQAFEQGPGWRELLDRLPAALAPGAASLRAALKR